jgi:type II secretory pathway component PulC
MPGEEQVKKLVGKASSAVIYMAALALLLWAGLDLYQRYQFHQDWRAKQKAEKPAAIKKPQVNSPQNTRQVANKHLFGKKKLADKPATITKAPATRLNLKLIGVIATQEEGVSKAIIQIGNANIGVYSTGDKLPKGNATIERIEGTQVLLLRNNKLESLAIIRPELEEKDLRGKIPD